MAGFPASNMKFSTSLFLASVLFGAISVDANATNFGGRFDMVQTDPSSSTGTLRYYNAAQALSIFAAPGSNATVLQNAFMRKTSVSISYTAQACPIGIGGSCGSLTFITVDANNIP